jgi:hypothetical protein
MVPYISITRAECCWFVSVVYAVSNLYVWCIQSFDLYQFVYTYHESLDTILQEEGNKHVLFWIYWNTQEDKKESTSNQMMKHSSKWQPLGRV